MSPIYGTSASIIVLEALFRVHAKESAVAMHRNIHLLHRNAHCGSPHIRSNACTPRLSRDSDRTVGVMYVAIPMILCERNSEWSAAVTNSHFVNWSAHVPGLIGPILGKLPPRAAPTSHSQNVGRY